MNSSDSHASVCSDETCSHGKNVDATVWLSFPLVFIMSLIVCSGGEAGLRNAAAAWCWEAGLSPTQALFSFIFYLFEWILSLSVYLPHPFAQPAS